MSAITETPTAPDLPHPPQMISGTRWMTRGVQVFCGASLLMAALGMWLTPGALDPELALLKLGMSIVAGLAGLAVLQAGRPLPVAEVEIDTQRGEVRLVRGKGRSRSLVSRMAIADLGPAEVNGTVARLWSPEGDLIAEVPIADPELRLALLDALRAAGKL